MKNKLSIKLLTRWIAAPLLVGCLFAWVVSPAYPSDVVSRVVQPQKPQVAIKVASDNASDVQDIKDRIKELESKERQNFTLLLDDQRKKIDWWFSFLAVLTAVMAIAGGLIPFLMARKDKEIIEQDKEKIKQRLSEIEAMRLDAANHVDKIHQDAADVVKAKEELQSYQSNKETENKGKIQQAIETVRKDTTDDIGLGLRTAAIAASEANEAEKAYSLWNALVQLNQNDASAQFNAGYWAQELGEHVNSIDSTRWLQLAGAHYQQALSINPDKRNAAFNWGNALAAEAQFLGASDLAAVRRLWQQAGEKYQQALRIKPNEPDAINNWGNVLAAEAQVLAASDPVVARSLWQQAEEKYQEALRIKPDKHEAVYNWGRALDEEAQALVATDPEAARSLWQQAGEKYKEALRIKPDKHEAAYNWGRALDEEAQALVATDPVAARSLWQQAGEKYKEALRIKPDKHEAAYNWGCALDEEAQALVATDPVAARSLWQQAGEKFQLALHIKPNMHEAANSWGAVLLQVADVIAASDSEQLSVLLDQTEKMLLAHADAARGVVSYNLACVYGRRGDVPRCLHWLSISKTEKELPDCAHLSSDKDLDPVRNTPEFNAWFVSVCGSTGSPRTVKEDQT